MSLVGRQESTEECTDQEWAGARVTIVGLGREGVVLARFLAEHGALVTVTDRQDATALAGAVASLADLPLQFALGGHPDRVLDADVIFVSPGIQRTIPLLVEAARRGIRLSSETELFFSSCPAAIIGITGSSGKTTTSTLVGLMLTQTGFQTWVGGNIGQPLLGELARIRPEDKVVLELSSFQLEHLKVSPHIGTILNVTPNHLDRHGTMDAYVDAKRNIVSHQQAGDVGVFGLDDAIAGQLSREHRESRIGVLVAHFSAEHIVERGVCVHQGHIACMRSGGLAPVCDVGEIVLRGRHNLYNVLAACAVAAESGAVPTAMQSVATTFSGVEHRLEMVRDVRGVRYVNDSIATSPERSMAALRSYEEPIVLLAGGRDKHLPWEGWAQLAVHRTRAVVLFGEAAGLIEQALGNALARDAAVGRSTSLTAADIHRAGTLEAAVAVAHEIARPGDVVLLSPGGTSYDAFTDFEQRGRRFRESVRLL